MSRHLLITSWVLLSGCVLVPLESGQHQSSRDYLKLFDYVSLTHQQNLAIEVDARLMVAWQSADAQHPLPESSPVKSRLAVLERGFSGVFPDTVAAHGVTLDTLVASARSQDVDFMFIFKPIEVSQRQVAFSVLLYAPAQGRLIDVANFEVGQGSFFKPIEQQRIDRVLSRGLPRLVNAYAKID